MVAPNAFKESLDAPAVARSLGEGLEQTLPAGWSSELVPQADGGEGTVAALVAARGGRIRRSDVTGPRGGSVTAEWGWIPEEKRAVIEMAAASGLARLDPKQRDPMRTTTRGTGELLMEAVRAGARRVLVGLGGSATVDGGLGLARALGFECRDASGRSVDEGGRGLQQVETIRRRDETHAFEDVNVTVASDVSNPLLGEDGGVRVFAPQKGADAGRVEQLEAGMEQWADVLEEYTGRSLRDRPGAGAAGGLGFALAALLDADLQPGAKVMMEATGLNSRLPDADVLITGEGQMDRQTLFGKTPYAVAQRARRCGVSVVLGVTGALGEGYEELYDTFDLIFTLATGPMDRSESLDRADELLRARGKDVGRLVAIITRH